MGLWCWAKHAPLFMVSQDHWVHWTTLCTHWTYWWGFPTSCIWLDVFVKLRWAHCLHVLKLPRIRKVCQVHLIVSWINNATSWQGWFVVGFDHFLPCHVENMARGTQYTKTEAEGRGFFRYWGPRAMFFTRYGRPWSNPIITRSLINFFLCFSHKNMNFSALKWAIFGSLHCC